MDGPDVVDWDAYYAATLEKPLHPIFERLESHLPPAGMALELGCGVGHGVLWLLGRGFEVIAVDKDPRALTIVQGRLPEGAACRCVEADFATYEPPPVDLVCAGFSLFFLAPREFEAFWSRLRRALRPGGVFVGQLLGVDDDWRDRGYAVHTSEEARRLFDGFDVLEWEEANRPGKTVVGQDKHWHVFHVVARRQ